MNWIKSKKEILINGVLVVFGILVALAVAEFGLRMFQPEQITLNDPLFGAVPKPGNGRDANGFRNHSVPQYADIVTIGDSQTDGNNAPTIEDTWPSALARLSGKSVYQMAFSGYGPVQYDALFDKALSFNPKLIIIGFYLGNDLNDVFRSVYQSEARTDLRNPLFHDAKNTEQTGESDIRLMLQSGYEPNSLQLSILRLRRWVRFHSKLYTLLGDGTRQLREKIGLAETKEETGQKIEELADQHPDIAFVYKKEPIKTVLSPTYRLDVIDLQDPNVAESFRISKFLFEKMNERALKNGSSLIIAIIPTKEMVYGAYLRDVGEQISPELSVFLSKESEITNELLKECANRRWSCVAALPSLVNALKEGRKIYPSTMDGHPIPSGYQAIAKEVYENVKKEIYDLD